MPKTANVTVHDILEELRSAGTEQTRNTYARHGMGECYGVSFAHMGKMAKKIKTNQKLAEELWADGIAESHYLAGMIADPGKCSPELIDAWADSLTHHADADMFSRSVAAKVPFAREKAELWVTASHEWKERAGWLVLGQLTDEGCFTDGEMLDRLDFIEAHVHAAKNRVRDAMMQVVIYTGLQGPAMREAAIATARRVGKVEVDHGDTDCKTPDTEKYILKTEASRAAKAAKSGNKK